MRFELPIVNVIFFLCSHNEVIVVISPIPGSSRKKRDTDAMVYATADEAYDDVDMNGRPAGYVAEEVGPNLPDGGMITIGDNSPDTDVPLRMGYSFQFFLRIYPLDVSSYFTLWHSIIRPMIIAKWATTN